MKLRILLASLSLAMVFGHVAIAQPASWTVNGKAMPLTEFIAQVAEYTGKTIVLDPRMKNQDVTVFSSVSLDADGLYELFLTVLKVHNLGVVESDGVISIIDQPRLKQSGGPVAAAEGQPAERLITQVVPLAHVSSSDLMKMIRPLIPQTGHISAIETPNVVIIADAARNMQRLATLIEQIDVLDKDEVVHLVLEHAWVGTVAAVLEEIAPEQIGRNAKGPRRVRIVANERNNSLILKGKPHPIAEALRLIDKLDVPETNTGSAQVFYLNHADAVSVADILNRLGDSSSGAAENAPAATIQAYESLNALIIRADPTTTNELLATVSQLDVRRAQVLIEAAIVEVSVDVVDALGVELAGADASSKSVPLVTTTLNGIIGTLLSSLGVEDDDVDFIDGIAGANSPTLAVARLDPDGISFGAVINALLTDTRANLLSTPSVLTLDNEEATQIAGQRIPFRTGSFTTTTDGSSNPFQTINRENVGVELKVTPHIHEDSSIRMVVSLKVGSVVESAGIGTAGFADVVTSERSLESTVLAEDRQIILLGGLVQDDYREVSKKVPLLGSIPFVGRAFRSNRETLKKGYLLMFLRPTIFLSGDEAERVAEERFQGIYRLQGESEAEDALLELEGLFDIPSAN